ncbi:RagB/SusD family nutrient uptake outer membrane protein [Sinomicrobium pectinilyticum]|uniref:RagB/SusD family nutrient uptake outer membrane protein n=1 Tax=Sinomicrobium pectinilyticum TaxID=1084421 RepID=A0A3N0DQU1_SINP1|nr:RagB/SusD family nutrient uptake outer membrane protein [Sinomicrobium pectinilyticum]RNL77836.1 RagB/SusD family nutrient uptake outer membrane protein [Sinomicrobium pectinilyticum]
MKRIIYTIFTAVTLVACNVDRFPYEDIREEELFENEGAIEAVTLGNYSILKGDADGYGFAPQLHRYSEYPGDNVSLSGTTTDPLFYAYNYRNIINSYRSNDLWSSGFRAVVGCNKVISLIEEGESPESDQLIGENYFLRAYVFFQMVNVYGRPYAQGTSNLGVPLKLTADVNDLPDRSTVGEVYEQVISDLLKAESLMNIEKTNAYATKEAAQALLSRVYLYMEENEKAIEYADKVINSGRFQLVPQSEMGRYFAKVPEENTETIFCFRYHKESDYSNGWYTVGSLYASIQNVGWGEMYASASYLDLINRHPGDVRKEFIEPQYLEDEADNLVPAVYWTDPDYKYQFRKTFEQNGKTYFKEGETNVEVQEETDGANTRYYFMNGGNKVYVVKDYDMEKRNGYPKFYILKASMQENIPQLWSPVVSRLAEMYLNKAEAYAKMGNGSEAIANVDVLRERAGIPAYENISGIPEGQDVLDVVLDERRLEFAYEGHRKFDVFRNDRVMDRRYPGTHLNGNNPYYEVQPTDNRVIEYIPENQINAQPSLIQND